MIWNKMHIFVLRKVLFAIALSISTAQAMESLHTMVPQRVKIVCSTLKKPFTVAGSYLESSNEALRHFAHESLGLRIRLPLIAVCIMVLHKAFDGCLIRYNFLCEEHNLAWYQPLLCDENYSDQTKRMIDNALRLYQMIQPYLEAELLIEQLAQYEL